MNALSIARLARETHQATSAALDRLNEAIADIENQLEDASEPPFVRPLGNHPDAALAVWSGKFLVVVSAGGTISVPAIKAKIGLRLALLQMFAGDA